MRTFRHCLPPVAALAALLSARAEPTFYSAPSGDWSTSGNWSAGIPTGVGSTYVANNNSVTISGGANSVGDFWIGNCCGGTLAQAGTVFMSGGTLTVNNNLQVGNDGRNGVFNFSNGTLNGASRTLNISRGGDLNVTSTGTFNMSGGVGTFATTNIGNDSLSTRLRFGHLDVSGGQFTNTGSMNLGNSSFARGTVNVTGGTLTAGGDFNIAPQANTQGTLRVAGGSVALNQIRIGNGADSQATINLSSGTVSANNVAFGNGANSTPNFILSGGTFNLASYFDSSNNASSAFTFTQTGGVLNQSSSNFHLGMRGAGTLNLSGGTINKTGGGEFDIGEGRDATATARATLNLSGNGVINQATGNLNLARTAGTGTLNISGGTYNKTSTGLNRIGVALNTYGYVNLSGGQFTTNGDVRLGDSGHGSMTQTGGRWDAQGSWFTVADQNTAARGTYNISGGVLNHTGGNGINIGVRGDGTFLVSGTGVVQGGAMTVGRGESGTTPTGRWTQTGGQGIFNSLQVGLNNATGIFNLEGGTFRVSTINNLVGGGSQFNWGAGALSPRQFDAGNASGPDLSSGTGFTEVRRSTTTFLTNANLTTGNGVDAPSRLDLGGIYLSAGNVLFDTLTVGAGRTLNLASTTDVLEWNDDTSYLLRPFGFFTEDYGSLPLVATTGGGTITGTFDTFLGLSNDGRGFSQFTGVFSSASALPTNTWYLEQTASAITFHYKVAGTVPEPGTFGLAAIGAYLLRTVRRRRG
jgi:hypothetical protein